MTPGLYIGLDGPDEIAAHNAAVAADAQADTCRCFVCSEFGDAERAPPAIIASTPLRPATGVRGSCDDGDELLTERANASPTVPLRGSVQDESGVLDPMDAAAMRAVERRDRAEVPI